MTLRLQEIVKFHFFFFLRLFKLCLNFIKMILQVTTKS